jgi:hypothetical protein
MPNSVAEEPFSPHFYANITPEDSVLGLTYGLTDVSPAASPNVSSNSSWVSDANQPSSIYRFAHNHERHEELAISLSAVPDAVYPWTVGNATADDRPPFAKAPDVGVNRSFAHSDAPLHRYVSDVHAHELLAVALKSSQDQPTQQHPIPPPKHNKVTRSTILLSGGVEAIEEGEDADVTEELARSLLYVFQNPALEQTLIFVCPPEATPDRKNTVKGNPGGTRCPARGRASRPSQGTTARWPDGVESRMCGDGWAGEGRALDSRLVSLRIRFPGRVCCLR